MNAAAPLPARAIRLCAAILLCGGTACAPDVEPSSQTAAPSASSVPTLGANGNPAYMTDHVATDAALAQALIGTWTEAVTILGAEAELVTTFAADRSVSKAVFYKTKPETTALTIAGNWDVERGFLTYTFTVAGEQRREADELLKVTADQWVYVDSDDKKTKVAVRRAALSTTVAATAPSPQPAIQPAPAVAAAPPEAAPFVDETLFVASDDVGSHTFRLSAAAQVRLTVDIEEKVPLSVVLMPGKVAPTGYVMHLAALTIEEVFSTADGNRKVSPLDDLFKSRLSKRAAYGRFASPWVTLQPGTYTVILDNSGELTPTRGDAPLRLQLFSRAAP